MLFIAILKRVPSLVIGWCALQTSAIPRTVVGSTPTARVAMTATRSIGSLCLSILTSQTAETASLFLIMKFTVKSSHYSIELLLLVLYSEISHFYCFFLESNCWISITICSFFKRSLFLCLVCDGFVLNKQYARPTLILFFICYRVQMCNKKTQIRKIVFSIHQSELCSECVM